MEIEIYTLLRPVQNGERAQPNAEWLDIQYSCARMISDSSLPASVDELPSSASAAVSGLVFTPKNRNKQGGKKKWPFSIIMGFFNHLYRRL